ncbi:MAG: co-chaperone GroES [Deltaproteobacteria bacterium]|nr:co-chaperone GroES [Deltaproteobacteria bacterium]
MKTISPLSGNILIEINKAEEVTASGIIIPGAAQERPSEGKVIAVAADADDQILVGDVVIYKKYSGTEITYDDKKYRIVPDGDILAKYVESDAI